MKTWINNEMPLLMAWGILLVLVLPRLFIRGGGIAEYIFWMLELLLLLVCVRYIRGKKVQSRKPPYQEKEMGIWGYIWRSQVSLFVTAILAVLASFLITGKGLQNSPFLSQVLLVVCAPVVVWLIFCKERIAFARKVFLYLSGMPAH